MKIRIYARTFVLILACSVLPAGASLNIYDFEDEEKRQQFDELIDELRCPKCQNQNIADSDAGVAKLIKDRVYKLVQEGKSKQQVTDHMISRYGEFVTYRPPIKKTTLLLWFGPAIGLVIAIIALCIFVIKRNRQPPPTLSQSQHEKVEELLKKYTADDSQDPEN